MPKGCPGPGERLISEGPSFRDLILRVRAGDEAAAADLVRRYEPAIRRAVRLRLRDPCLGRLCDSMDVCQSVLASFFVRAALGQYDLNSTDQLLRLRRQRDPLGEGQPCTWRTLLIKVAAEVVVRTRLIVVRLSSSWPHLDWYRRVCERLRAPLSIPVPQPSG
jgi:hypothetical protein